MAGMIKAKKGLGQHFLTQKSIAKEIVKAFVTKVNGSPVLEIGPGKGILTGFLADYSLDLYLIDADLDMISILQNRFPDLVPNTIHADILKFPLDQFFKGNFNIIGNFPYNISSQIAFKILNHRNQVNLVVGMFQKEVAERLCAKHGSKKYGILSVFLQIFYSMEYLFSVEPSAFSPAPKVTSGVVRMTRNQFDLDDKSEKFLRLIVKSAFNKRRKMLRNSLKSFIPEHAREDEIFSKRPEQLSVQDFLNLSQQLLKLT